MDVFYYKEPISNSESAESNTEDDSFNGSPMKDTDKLRLMLLAWNYHQQIAAGGNTQTQANNGTASLIGSPPLLGGLTDGADSVAGLWNMWHQANKTERDRTTPSPSRTSLTPAGNMIAAATVSNNTPMDADGGETSSSGNKEEEDEDEEDEGDDLMLGGGAGGGGGGKGGNGEETGMDGSASIDPERLKAFNMFVRLFVDENLDRAIPISRQPRDKVQAIIDSCSRQFPDLSQRARKRIRTYLKSCRRNKQRSGTSGTVSTGLGTAWDNGATRPTPAHLTSVQAEQILATACENESMNAKRMRMGLDPVSQPLPVLGNTITDTTAPIGSAKDFSYASRLDTESSIPSTTVSVTQAAKTNVLNTLNGNVSNASSAMMYRPNFSQAFQRSVAATNPYQALFPVAGFPFGLISGASGNGPTDLSVKPHTPHMSSSNSLLQHSTLQQSRSNTPQQPQLTPTQTDQSKQSTASIVHSHAHRGSVSSNSSNSTIATSAAIGGASSTNLINTNMTTHSSISSTNASIGNGGSLAGHHKLNANEIAAVRQLVAGYRESAAFLLRSADELEQLLLVQQ